MTEQEIIHGVCSADSEEELMSFIDKLRADDFEPFNSQWEAFFYMYNVRRLYEMGLDIAFKALKGRFIE